MENVCGLHVTQVIESLASENLHRLLIIDCRSFMSFNKGRIAQSINIHCPPILKRRSGGFISLENIVPCERKRIELQTGLLTDVLIYDENTVHLNQAPKDSNLLSVVKSLLKQVVGVTIRFITGGYEAVCDECPALCVRQDASGIHAMRDKCFKDVSESPSFIEPAEIFPHLYLGNEAHSSQRHLLERLGITALINVSSSFNHFDEHFRYMNISISDSMNADILSWFSKAIDFIDDVSRVGGKVLVHCWAGISRSATVCIAYVMQKRKMSLDEAFELVMARRSVIDPNINFIQQLQKFESFLQLQNSRNALQQPKSPAPWSSHSPVFSFPPVITIAPSPSSSSSSLSVSLLSPSNPSSSSTTSTGVASLYYQSPLINQTSSKLKLTSTSLFQSNVPYQTPSRCSSAKESLRPSDLDLSPSSLSQSAASPSPHRTPSRPASLPLIQLNSPLLPYNNAKSVGGSAAAETSTEIFVGSTFLLSPLPASPLLDFDPQPEDDVAMGIPVAQSMEGGREFTFFTGEMVYPDVTIPLDLVSPRFPAHRSASTRRDSPLGMFPSLSTKPHSPISPTEVPVSPLPLYGQSLAF